MSAAALSAQARLLAVIEALAGHEVDGLTLTDVAAALGGITPSTVLRDMAELEAAGWARRVPGTKRWALAARPIQLLINFQSGLARAKQRIAEVESNYTRLPA
ncbi:MAG: helix-turn-helix domain-containing protein [Azoarcus sp.]|jgi:DNA-binding IclR family transcriptional regulator|nr:helix-turn-helix domain-containing protein [Azoarcus sp.]